MNTPTIPAPLDLSKIQTGTRLKVHTPYTFGGVQIPAGATVEVLNGTPVTIGDANGMQHTALQCRAGWKDWSGTAQQLAAATIPVANLAFGKGRPMFPGEAPPKQGDTFGVTGKNNDYAKLAKQGKRKLVVPATATPQQNAVIAASVAIGSPLGSDRIGTPCPKCGSSFTLRSGVRKTDGQPFAFVGCSSFPSCRVRISSNDGAVYDGKTLIAAAPAVTTVTAPAAPAAMPTPSAPVGPTPDEVTPVVSASPKVAKRGPQQTKSGFIFPADTAMKMADDVRKMQRQGTSEMTFSLRKLLAWGTASTALFSEGMAAEEAVAAGFRLVALDRETDESRETLRTLFQSHFGYEVTKGDKHPAMDTAHIIRVAIAAGLNLWLSGPTGCGKTHSVLEVLKADASDYIRFQGGRDATRETLIGYPALSNGSSTFRDGPLVTAIRRGIPLIVDEIDKLRDEVLSELTAVLEGNDLVIADNGGERLSLSKGFCVVATANTVGRGEGTLYSGTGTVNEAIRDRFIFLGVDYDSKRDAMILRQHLASL